MATSGEIYIGGNGVGRGYRNLSRATERSFLPDPFAGAPAPACIARAIAESDGRTERSNFADASTGKRRSADNESNWMRSVAFSWQHPSIDFATAITVLGGGRTNSWGMFSLRGNACRSHCARTPAASAGSLPDYMVPIYLCAIACASVIAQWET